MTYILRCDTEARWCTVSDVEYKKCTDIMAAIQEREATSRPYPLRSRKYSELPTFTCMKVGTLQLGVKIMGCIGHLGKKYILVE